MGTRSMEVLMLRKVLTASIIGFMFTSLLVATPAGAATITNGVACKKSGASTKVGTNVYKCTKNPTVANAKLTWVWSGCLEANTTYQTSQATVKSLSASLAKNFADTKASGDALALGILDSINKMLSYRATTDYVPGDTVWVSPSYFVANVAVPRELKGTNAPSATNTGLAGSTSLWIKFAPTGVSPLNKALDLVPSPDVAIAARQADIANWNTIITKLAADSKKLIAGPVTTKNTATLNLITTQIKQFSSGVTAATNQVNALKASVATIKRLTSAQTTLTLVEANLAGAKQDVASNLMIRSQACKKGV